jgi:hypothetical protein
MFCVPRRYLNKAPVAQVTLFALHFVETIFAHPQPSRLNPALFQIPYSPDTLYEVPNRFHGVVQDM